MSSNGYTLAHPADLDGETSYTFTCGKIDAGIAVLIGSHAHLIEFPSLLLPPGCEPGSIVSITCARDLGAEKAQADSFWELQNKILNQFGVRSPETPTLRLRSVTQTSITLEWDRLQLAQSKLLSLSIWKNGQRLGAIPNPTNNTSTKLSGLDLDTEYNFYLVMKTSGGTFNSNKITVKTHSLNDTSGINVCFGVVLPDEILEQSKQAVDQLNARWSDKIQIDTTHFVCTMAHNPTQTHPKSTQASSFPSLEYQRALQLSIPIVQPSWLLACLSEKKMVPIAAHYLGTQPPPLNSLPTFSSSTASITRQHSAGKPTQPSSPLSPNHSKSSTPTSPRTPDASANSALESASETPRNHHPTRHPPPDPSTPPSEPHQAGLSSEHGTPTVERRRSDGENNQRFPVGQSSGSTTITVEQPPSTHSVLSDILHDTVDTPDTLSTQGTSRLKQPPQMVVTPSGGAQTEAEDDPFSASSPTISNPSPCGDSNFTGLKFDLSSTACSPITPVGVRPEPEIGRIGNKEGDKEYLSSLVMSGEENQSGFIDQSSEHDAFENVSVNSPVIENQGPTEPSEVQVTVLKSQNSHGGNSDEKGEGERGAFSSLSISNDTTSGSSSEINFENRVAGVDDSVGQVGEID